MVKSDSLPPPLPDFSREAAALAGGACFVAGLDEAGRGPLAGPVVAAAVVLDVKRIPKGLNDSKKLTAARREALFAELCASAHVAFCAAPPAIIDRLNIRGATLWAMCGALDALPVKPDLALVDGRDIPPGLSCPGHSLIGGDGLSVSVAAASIVAKVVRDRMCVVLEGSHPGYGFAAHKGYGTPVHLEALAALGPTDHHRRSFAPVLAAAR